MWDLSVYIKTWLRSHKCAGDTQSCAASQRSAVKQEDPVWKYLQANSHFIRTIWCSLALYLVWERRSHTFSSTTPRGGSSKGAAWLQPSLKNVRQKIPPNGQTRLKSGFSCEISQHNHFRYFRHHFGRTFPRNPSKPMFCSFPSTPLMRWRFQHTCWWIWRFRGCLRHSPKGKKPNNWLQETWCYVRL